MKLEYVVQFLNLCAQNDIEVWIDGGWGVDSLLGKQTREHNDLDIALHHSDVPKLRKLLVSRGFEPEERGDTTEYNFVLKDKNGHKIDFHSFELNEDGSNALGVAYIAEHLTGIGMIGNKKIKTIDPKWLVEFHTLYEPDEKDYHDVKLLCTKFNIPLPDNFKKFVML